MELWIPITIAAAFFQNVRTALQKHLKGRLSTGGATFTRFFYALPFSFFYVLGLHEWGGYAFLETDQSFYFYVVLGGGAQIFGTAMLVTLFSLRNFAIGTVYSKTETVQAALFGLVLLGDTLSVPALIAIGLSFVGIMLISSAGGRLGFRDVLMGWTGKTAIYGLISGGLFGVSAVCYRAGALSLSGDGVVMQAATTLIFVLCFQTTVMLIYLAAFEKGQIRSVLQNWKTAIWVGVTSMLGSVGWFTAMTLQNAAYVRAVGQVELIFTFLIAYFYFKERTSRIEIFGILFIVVGILILVLGE